MKMEISGHGCKCPNCKTKLKVVYDGNVKDDLFHAFDKLIVDEKK